MTITGNAWGQVIPWKDYNMLCHLIYWRIMANRIKLTKQQLDYIQEKYTDGMSISDIAKELNLNYGIVWRRLKSMGIFSASKKYWTDDELNYLKDNYAYTPWNDLCKFLNGRDKMAIISKASELGLKREIHFWTDEDIKMLTTMYVNKIPLKEMEKRLEYRHSQGAISAKANKLGLQIRTFWSESEDERLREIYPVYDMEQICDEFPNRSRGAIITHAIQLGLSYKTTWTDEETSFLKHHCKTMTDEEIGAYLGRSSDSVRGKRFLEKYYRPSVDGTYNYLSEYIRKRNKEWKLQSAKRCNYKCVITGKRFQAIHHLYGMNKILEETLESLGYPANVEYNTLSANELDAILKQFYKIQANYPLGICLIQSIHKEFHDIYGYGNNTPEQFKKFIEDKKYKIKIA